MAEKRVQVEPKLPISISRLPVHARRKHSKSKAILWSLAFVLSSLYALTSFVPGSKLLSFDLYSSESRSAQVARNDARVDNKAQNQPPYNNGLTDIVEWDEYSLILKGQRVFLWSGEFHTWRLPVPDLWPDILQKIKAAGLNGISIYVHWGLVNPSREVFDFEGYRSLTKLFDAAMDVGLWVVLRPGPYINAETTAGGIPHWVTAEVPGHLRTNDTSYANAWAPYIERLAVLARPAQITEGGPIIAIQIDNEYTQNPDEGYPGKGEMMRDIQLALKRGGIVVPLTYNDASPEKNFVEGIGKVDIYGLDSYPQGFDCANPDVWEPLVTNYYDYHMSTNGKQPFYSPEFQAGAFDAWGPNAPGYTACEKLLGVEFESVFFKNLWASNFKLVNLYMVYGGTSWGHLPFPGVYTSYDYGAAISESREIGSSKYAELKRQAMFLRSTPEFYATNVLGNSTEVYGHRVVKVGGPSKDEVFVTLLKSKDSEARFYVSRQMNSSSIAETSFSLHIQTSVGPLHIPQTQPNITLSGRDSKVIVTDLTFGSSSHLLYTTTSIMWAGKLGDRDTLFLYGDSRQHHEASIMFKQHNTAAITSNAFVTVHATANNGFSLVTFDKGIEGLVTVWDSPEQIVLFSDTDTAGMFWFPSVITTLPTSMATTNPFAHFWQFGTNDTILVGGPHLVRSAVVSGTGPGERTTLELYGDLKDSARLILIGVPTSVRRLTWNGQDVESDLTLDRTSEHGRLEAFLPSRRLDSMKSRFDPPELKDWKYADSLPETRTGFSDAEWMEADKTSTNSPYKPYFGKGPVLYSCDYGFCEGIVIWRGHFNGSASGVSLSVNGGSGFAATVWLNQAFLGTLYGNSSNNLNTIGEVNATFTFSSEHLSPGDNVLTIVQGNMGLEETEDWDTDSSKSPRGIRGYALHDNQFSSWKVQGKLGGYKHFPDVVRGIFNEGGTFGERRGWHLPGYSQYPEDWTSRELSAGIPDDKAGLGFFITTFSLNIPDGFDVPMSFVFESSVGQPYRAALFINGWMMGKRVANLGPQYDFPVHEGILDYHGNNTVAVMIWAMEDTPINPQLFIRVKNIYDGGVGRIATNNPPWIRR